MAPQDDTAASVDGRLNCRNIRIRIARPGDRNGLRRYGPRLDGDGADYRNQSSFQRDLLFAFAGHLAIPVHERAVGVVPPGPDVQLEVRRQAVTVRAGNELERLPLQHRRTAVTL